MNEKKNGKRNKSKRWRRHEEGKKMDFSHRLEVKESDLSIHPAWWWYRFRSTLFFFLSFFFLVLSSFLLVHSNRKQHNPHSHRHPISITIIIIGIKWWRCIGSNRLWRIKAGFTIDDRRRCDPCVRVVIVVTDKTIGKKITFKMKSDQKKSTKHIWNEISVKK